MSDMPYIVDSLLIILMGFITWQATSKIPQVQGRQGWFIGSLFTGLGLVIELTVLNPQINFIGFITLAIGMSISCMSLELFLQIRKRISLLLLATIGVVLISTFLFLPEQLVYVADALIMAMLFFWYILIFIRMNDAKSIQGVGVFFFLYSTTVLLFLIRCGFGIYALLNPIYITEEPELISYLILTFATLSTISTSALFLSIILLNHSDTLRSSAERDSLTGTFNRRSLDVRLSELPLRNVLFSLVMIDLDHFKEVNDTYGHDSGDKVLKMLAEHVTDSIRGTDFFARYGGEEFCIIMENASAAMAHRVIDRIRANFHEQSLIVNESKVVFSFSAGVCDNSGAYFTSEEILRQADKALYRAKESGRNCVVSAE